MSKRKELSDKQLFAVKLDYKCPYDWSKMKGDDRIRFCGACKKNVYNISKLSRQQAVDIINKKRATCACAFTSEKTAKS